MERDGGEATEPENQTSGQALVDPADMALTSNPLTAGRFGNRYIYNTFDGFVAIC